MFASCKHKQDLFDEQVTRAAADGGFFHPAPHSPAAKSGQTRQTPDLTAV